MRYLKLYENFNDIDSICRKYGITKYTINDDGSIDVDYHVDLDHRGLTELPLKFRNVNGFFSCSHNQLTTLSGCPERVEDSFSCIESGLTSLEFAPKYIGRDFTCWCNNIRDFDDMYPYTTIGGNFYCDGNPIHEVWWLFKDKDAIELLIDYDIFRNNGESIVLIRLNAFLEHIERPTVQSVEGYKII